MSHSRWIRYQAPATADVMSYMSYICGTNTDNPAIGKRDAHNLKYIVPAYDFCATIHPMGMSHFVHTKR